MVINKRKFSWLNAALFVMLILIVILPSRGQAQNEVSFSSVEIDLWPEFDTPSMLVIYRITLNPTVSLPAEIRFRIPANAGIPNAVAGRQPDGVMINIPYNQEPSGEWTWLVFQALIPDIQVEYYDPDLIKDGDKRHFEYTWMGDYAVDSLFVEVQQPTGASDVQIKPGMATVESVSDILKYYLIDVGALSTNQPFSITLDYSKQDDHLSINNLPIEPASPLDNTTTGRMRINSNMPMVLGILGVVLLVGGVIWYWHSGSKFVRRQSNQRKRKERNQTISDSIGEDPEHIYCHHCGKRASHGDLFCRACGSQLRR